MKKTIWIYGIIAGVILSLNLILMTSVGGDAIDFDSGAYFGYASMVIVFSLIYFGVRAERNKLEDKTFGFWPAFKTGFFLPL